MAGGISPAAVGIVAGGGFLVWTGIRNVGVLDGLRELSAGKLPAEGPQTVTATSTAVTGTAVYSGVGATLVGEARRHIGAPYVWGAEGPTAFDCSGLVVYCLNQIGVKVGRLTAAGFLTWSGATTIDRADMQPGDLVCWGGHIGIASGPNTMINAPNRGARVREEKIWTHLAPAVIRRVNGGAVTPSAAAQARARLQRIG